MTGRSAEHGTFVIERSFPAAAPRVFAAWSSAEAKSRWFGPGSRASIELDFQVGGHERFSAQGPDGARYRYIALYQDIVPDERIVYTYEMYRDEDRISVSVATIELTASGEETQLTLTEQGVFLDGHDTVAPARARHARADRQAGGGAGLVSATIRQARPAAGEEARAPSAGAGGGASRWAALYVLCAGMLMIVLDVTVVNVALPSIQDQLHFSNASLAWVVNAYLISFGGLLLLAGRLGDLVGRRRVFLAGIGLFTLASLLCGLADSQALLVGARFLQGVGGAMTSAVILGMIVTMFPAPREQAKAIGVYAFVASAGGSVGLLAGGVITQSIDWHWIFFINVPIGAATALLARRMLARRRGHRPCGGRGRAGRGADHGRADGRRLRDRRAGRLARLGRRAHARPGAVEPGAARRLRGARGLGGEPAGAASDLPHTGRGRGERRADPVGRRDVRDVLPRRPVPAAACCTTTRSRSAWRSCR